VSLQHLSENASQWAERGAYLFAGVAFVSLSQAALWATLISALVAIVLGAFRIHDRIKYGPKP
jgi:hypothetical protein